MSYSNKDLLSRFITTDDLKNNEFVFNLPESWWSRIYEYPWAAGFVETKDTVLDAACGLSHPLKFYLSDHCKKVHACDIDERLLSKDKILEDIEADYGMESIQRIKNEYFENIEYKRTSLTKLPYEDKMFDKVFCISVLEHLSDMANKYPKLTLLKSINFIPRAIRNSLFEFKRILKDDGLIILTFDYPDINLDYLQYIIKKLNLSFAGTISGHIPENALYSIERHLYCFRAVLKKAK